MIGVVGWLQIPAPPAGTEWDVRAEVGAVLVATALALAPLTVLAVRRIFPGRTIVFARWGFSHVAQLAILGAGLAWLAWLVLPGEPVEEGGSPLAPLVRAAAILAAACGFIAWAAHRLDPDGLRCLGLRRGRHLSAVVAGVVAYAMSLPGILGLGLLWPWFLVRTGAGFELPEVARTMIALPPQDRPLAIALAVVLMPLLEEIVFRVFLQPLLVQNLSDKLGIVATSLIFAALHGTSAFLPIFGLSLVLGSVMLRTQRLSAVWAIHALHNGLVLAAMYALPSDALGPAQGGLFFP